MTVSQPIGYETFIRRVVLRGSLTLISGLHIGCGREIGLSGSDLPVLKDMSGRPFIPGSSLKGVVRSNLEAFLRSFEGTTRRRLACHVAGTKDEGDNAWCIPREEKEKLIKQHNADVLIWQQSCWVCQAFGSPWLASKVQVLDLPLASGWRQEMLQVRDGVAIDRESETAAPKMKFDFEVVPPGTRFDFEVLVENPDDYQLGMLIVGLDMLNDGFALLGGNTSRGLGRVRVDIENVDEVTPDILLARLRGGCNGSHEYTEPTDGEESPGAAEVKAEPGGDELFRDIRACLQQSGVLKHDDLVAAMQERGWTKSKLRDKNFKNWAALLKRLLEEEIIQCSDNRYHLPGVADNGRTAVEEERPSAEDAASVRSRAENDTKMKIWRDALYQKIKNAREV